MAQRAVERKRDSNREIALLLALLDEAFDARAWHGTTLRGSLRGVTAEMAVKHPRPRRHSIWEFVLHTAYWKYAVRRMLTGEKRGSFALKGSNWFPVAEDPAPSPRLWKEAVDLLIREHETLRAAVADLADRDLERKTPKKRNTFRRIIYGIALHDVHHEGQIQLTKRLLGSGVE
jgi:uncharacterized damage-inducible protein DinB